jgi:LysM repeat protein
LLIGQTLYSISKAYDISEHLLLAENAELVNGLKVGIEIKIPANDGSISVKSDDGDAYIFHTIERKQTLYFLSNKYNVTEAEILRVNPEISKGLKTGQVIKIPKPGFAPVDPNADYKLHTVQPGETMFSLSQKYGIEISSLKIRNPELNDQGPRIGQVIKIPLAKKSFEEVIKIEHPNNSAGANFNYDPLYFEQPGVTPCSEFKYNNNIKFKVAVLLPLFIEENLLLKNSSNYYKFSGTSTGRFYEFYYGLLLASKKMKEAGVSVEFLVKDTKGNPTRTKEILRDEQLKDMDLIIGPVYSENFRIVSSFAQENKINIVAPFKQKYENLVVSNPFIFLADPSDETEIGNIAGYLAKSYDRSIIMVHNGSAAEIKIAETFKSKLVSSFSSNDNVNEIVFKQVNYKTGGATALEDALSIGLENIVIVPSKEVVFISSLATKLNYLSKRYKITVYGMIPWDQFESVETNYLQKIKFHYGTTNFVDHNDEKVKLFDYQYKTYFKNDASIYSYLGYDIAWYFLNVMKDYGKHFQFCMSSSYKKPYNQGLRFDFNFERVSPYSGFENNWLRIVEIDKNLQMVKVK